MKEIKKEKQRKQDEQKRKRVFRRIVKKMLPVLMMLLLCLVVYRCGRNNPDLKSEYETKVDEITEIDDSKQQEMLNAIVEEGKMNVNYSSKAIFVGTTSEKFNIKNIKNNHYPIVFSLYDEEDNCIYTSRKIEPGFEMKKIQLDRSLSKGIHEGKLKVGYAEEGNVSSVFPITIEVR